MITILLLSTVSFFSVESRRRSPECLRKVKGASPVPSWQDPSVQAIRRTLGAANRSKSFAARHRTRGMPGVHQGCPLALLTMSSSRAPTDPSAFMKVVQWLATISRCAFPVGPRYASRLWGGQGGQGTQGGTKGERGAVKGRAHRYEWLATISAAPFQWARDTPLVRRGVGGGGSGGRREERERKRRAAYMRRRILYRRAAYVRAAHTRAASIRAQ